MGRTALRKAARNTAFVIFSAALGGSGCTGDVGALADGGSNSGSGGGKGSGGASQSGSGGANAGSGGSSQSGSGGSSQSGSGGSSQNGSGGASQTGSGGSSQTGSGGATLACNTISPGRSPLRRLTTYEYNNTVKDLLSDATSPGSMLPAQVDSKQNLFGNDADQQSPSPLLIEKYQSVAESIAARATANATALGKLHSCAASVTTANEESCARMVATTLAPRAYRRTVTTSEVDELVALYKSVRAISTVTFASGVAAMIEAMLQAPDFLYRPEFGTSVASNTSVRRIAGREMATRLSYFFWQTMPDPAMFQAADAGMLDSNDGVRQYAQKLLDDPKSHATVAFFFDNLLPIPDLAGTGRDGTLFPTWSSSIGAAMRSEVQRVLEYEIFENTAQSAAPYATGSWPAILTLPYTFVNQALYSFYGPSTFASGTSAVTGTALKKVDLNTDQRRGLLTLGGFGAGSSVSNLTNPVLRGSFIVNKVMCRTIDLPTGFTPMPPDPYSGKTARERFSLHSANAQCAGCHKVLDPLGFPFENYDAVGLYRTSEKWTDPNTGTTYDTPIDASGGVPGVNGTAKNAVELVQQLATVPDVESCFASHWMRFAYGRSLDSTADGCNQQSVQKAFSGAGYNVKQLLIALTQSDGFLYRPAP